MKYLTTIYLTHPEYIEDIKRIMKVGIDHDTLISAKEAEGIWEQFSNDLAAGWLILPETDDELW